MIEILFDLLFFLIFSIIVLAAIKSQKKPKPDTTKRPSDLHDEIKGSGMEDESLSLSSPKADTLDTVEDAIDTVEAQNGVLLDTVETSIDQPVIQTEVEDIDKPVLAQYDEKQKVDEQSSVEAIQHPLIQDFNLRKAIIYSAIVEKKYF